MRFYVQIPFLCKEFTFFDKIKKIVRILLTKFYKYGRINLYKDKIL